MGNLQRFGCRPGLQHGGEMKRMRCPWCAGITGTLAVGELEPMVREPKIPVNRP